MNAAEFLDELLIGVEGSETSPLCDIEWCEPVDRAAPGAPEQASVTVTLDGEMFSVTVRKTQVTQ